MNRHNPPRDAGIVICSNCGTRITLRAHCARCGREVKPGEYITAQEGQYAGKPVCIECITAQAGLNLLGEAAKPNGAGTRPLPPLEKEDESRE